MFILDRDTVVETIVEIAAYGEHASDAEALLLEELGAYGYRSLDSIRIAGFCRTISEFGEPRAIASALYQLLRDRDTVVEFLDSESLAAACLLIQE